MAHQAPRPRENTFKVDLSNFAKRPSFEDMHRFIHEKIGLSFEQVVRLQMNHAHNCVHVKCDSLKTAQDAVDQHNGKHEMTMGATKICVRLAMEDGGVEIKVHDLSENIRNQDVVAYLQQYGDVQCIRDLVWGESSPYKGRPTGAKVVKMILHRHIRSFVTIQGELTLITYRNQPQNCRHCQNASHPGSTCVENKKLLKQKVDLAKRLENARNDNSYARVLKSNTMADIPAPNVNERVEPIPSSSTGGLIGIGDHDKSEVTDVESGMIIEMLVDDEQQENSIEASTSSNPVSTPSNPMLPSKNHDIHISDFSDDDSNENVANDTNENSLLSFTTVKRKKTKKPRTSSPSGNVGNFVAH